MSNWSPMPWAGDVRVRSSPFPPNGLVTIARITTILIAFACNDSTDPLRGAKYLVTASDSHPVAGTQITLKAQLVDANDKPIAFAGRVVAWYDASTGDYPSIFNPDSLETGADGSASTMFSPGNLAGVAHWISVLDGNGTRGSAAVITTVPGPPVMYIVRASDYQPEIGSTIFISAQLADQSENASKAAGRVVHWSQHLGQGGSLSSTTSTTNSDGVATVGFTVGLIADVRSGSGRQMTSLSQAPPPGSERRPDQWQDTSCPRPSLTRPPALTSSS